MSRDPMDEGTSLAPLTPTEALRALLKVDPEDEPESERRQGDRDETVTERDERPSKE